MIAPSARPEKGGVYTIVGGKQSRHDGRVVDECVRVWVVDDQASFRRATVATLAAIESVTEDLRVAKGRAGYCPDVNCPDQWGRHNKRFGDNADGCTQLCSEGRQI